jgi:hypothetical protein
MDFSFKIHIKSRVVSYWTRVIDYINSNEPTRPSSKSYIVLRELQHKNLVKPLWIENINNIDVRQIFLEYGMINVLAEVNGLLKQNFQKLFKRLSKLES